MIPTFEQVMRVTRDVSSEPCFPDADCEGLYNCCVQVPPGGLAIETGCQLGRSSSIIAQVGQAIGFHSLHIDPYTEQEGYLKGWVEMMQRIGGVREHAFVLLCMRTGQAEWHLSHFGQIDLAFIDGDHERAGVEIDLRLVADKVKPGGWLAAHDYAKSDSAGLVGVRGAINPYVARGLWDEVGVFGSLGVWRRK